MSKRSSSTIKPRAPCKAKPTLATRGLLGLVYGYRYLLSPVMRALLGPPACRHTPSCSKYALQALYRFGAARGGLLTIARIMRCHPWGSHGFDDVPNSYAFPFKGFLWRKKRKQLKAHNLKSAQQAGHD